MLRLRSTGREKGCAAGPGATLSTGNNGNNTLEGTDGVSGNGTAHGGAGTDSCTSDPGDTTTGCP